jgi:hypothetical protein
VDDIETCLSFNECNKTVVCISNFIIPLTISTKTIPSITYKLS